MRAMRAEDVTLMRHPEYLPIIALPLVLVDAMLFGAGILCARLEKLIDLDRVRLTPVWGQANNILHKCRGIALRFCNQ